MTIEELIYEAGEKVDGKCSLCKASNLWMVEGEKGSAKVCSWCDVSVDRRWSGFKDMDMV